MDQVNNNPTVETKMDAGHRFAAIGLFLSILAFTLSVTSPWIYEQYAPPSPTIEDIAVEKALSLKDKVIAKVTGEIVPVEKIVETPKNWTSHLFLIVICMGLGGVIMAMIGLLNRERGAVIVAASLFGVSAIVMQYAVLALGIIVLCILVAGILSTFGLSF